MDIDFSDALCISDSGSSNLSFAFFILVLLFQQRCGERQNNSDDASSGESPGVPSSDWTQRLKSHILYETYHVTKVRTMPSDTCSVLEDKDEGGTVALHLSIGTTHNFALASFQCMLLRNSLGKCSSTLKTK